MEQLCYVVLSCLLAIVLLYGLLELHYFLRMCLCVLLARFIKRRCHILETTSVNGEFAVVREGQGERGRGREGQHLIALYSF